MTNDKRRPPKIAEFLLKFLAPDNFYKTAPGDFEEVYNRQINDKGKLSADLWYWWQVLKSIPSFLIDSLIGSSAMLKNYLKIAWRNIKKNKGYSFINIFGLVIGITSSIVIFLYVQYELDFDGFHENADNIYRVIAKEPSNTYLGQYYYTTTQGILAPAMMEEYPEVEYATRFSNTNGILRNGEKSFVERGIYADEYFLKIFSFPLIEGDLNTALNEPLSIVLSEKLADKLFPEGDAVGKTVNYRNKYELKVTGIHKNVPENSHIKFEFLFSFATRMADPVQRNRIMRWNGSSFRTYFSLNQGASYKELEKNLVDLAEVNVGDGWMGADGERYRYFIQPLKRIHLYSHVNFEISENNDVKYIYLFSAIGFFIILIACFNYINLSTARSLKRFREIGIRKVVGAKRAQLFIQIILESFVFSAFSLIVSIVLSYLLLPLINTIADRNIVLDLSENLMLLVSLASIISFVGLFSGIYPAIYVSSFSTINVLKNDSRQFSGNSMIRNLLVTGQFFISIVLFVSTITILNQLEYINTKDLGYDIDNIIQVKVDPENFGTYYPSLKNSLLDQPGIIAVSSAFSAPMDVRNKTGHKSENSEGDMQFTHHYNINVDFDYLDLFNIEIVSGRNFEYERGTDEAEAVLINEAAVRDLGYDDPIGKKVEYNWGEKRKARVIGVVKDFHITSMHLKIQPLIIMPDNNRFSTLFIKVSPQKISKTVEEINRILSVHNPDYPYSYWFIRDDFDAMYRSEHRLAEIFVCFSGMAILIASLGLLGLISFISEQSKKEIGIRKVFGAQIPDVVIRLVKDFVKLVLLANIFAWPVAWYAMSKWIQNYEYRIEIGLNTFLIAVILSLLIAILTVSFQSIRAAVANPVDSLRYE